MSMLKQTAGVLAVVGLWSAPAIMGLTATPAAAQKFPSGPIEIVCTTKPGSGAAAWCQMLATELQKPDYLGVPVNVTFKSGGSNHEPVVYVDGKPADGHTLLHVSGSFYGYWNLPHFTKTYKDFEMLARVEQHLYGVAVRCDNSEGIKSWQDLVAYAKKNPGALAMGSNKIGSIHHRHHVALYDAAGIDVRFIPYQGTGDVVKDVVGGHLKVGFAQPSLWNPHIDAGTICPLALLNEERLSEDKNWKNVPSIKELGVEYDIPHQWQGFMVKKGTPDEAKDTLANALKKVTQSDAYKAYMAKRPHVVPNFEADRAKLTKDLDTNIPATRKFMIDNEIIKG